MRGMADDVDDFSRLAGALYASLTADRPWHDFLTELAAPR